MVESAKNHSIIREAQRNAERVKRDRLLLTWVSQEWPFGGGGICAGFSGRRKAEAERLESIGHFFNHS